MMMNAIVIIKKADINDLEKIEGFLKPFIHEGTLLYLPREKLEENIRGFLIALNIKNTIVGSIWLFEWGRELAEIRSFAVDLTYRGNGIGLRLLEGAVNQAKSLKNKRLFALTYSADFFVRAGSGFGIVQKESLPEKIWGDRIFCTSRNDCKEQAVALNL